jgi:hypothetical protein
MGTMKFKTANQCLLAALVASALAITAVSMRPAFADDAPKDAAAPAPAKAVDGSTVAAPAPFEVFPPNVNLNTSLDKQSVIVRVTQPDGVTRDVTAEAAFSLSNPELAKVQGHTVLPQADGACDLQVKYKDQTVSIPVTVKDAKADRPISFKLDVMPVFMKSGCNTGGCHGSARGKDGFRLSLFGFDPDGDYLRLTREYATRRVNLAIPEESLLLTKATGKVQHTGGTLFKEGEPLYNTVLKWLQAGAPQDPADVAKPVALEVYPKNAVLEGEGVKQQLVARAKYSDGTDRDVTDLCVFMTSNEGSAAVNGQGMITSGKRGEAFVMARFATFTVGTQVICIPKDQPYTFPSYATDSNYIDALVNAKLKKLRIVPSQTCTDEEFLRRATLDIVGLIPTPEEHDKFIADTDPQKREKLVDQLLTRKEFVELWVMKFAELLKIRSDNNQGMSYKATLLYFNWLQDQIQNNVPMDQIVQKLLGSTGGVFDNPAANYYQVERDPLKLAENTAQVFMGMRIQCAQCHNHPFDQWTQNDYYGFVAFFAQVGRKQGEDPRETIIFNGGGGEATHPITRAAVPPKFLGGDAPDTKGKDRREVLAKWIASKENPYFAKNLANIVWGHFMGKGIIDPVDDVRISNPASNPELLDALGQHFQEYNYDFKRLVRDICNSRTYQLSTKTNDTNELDERNFSHGPIRRVRAEVLLDMISEVTETKEKFRGLPLGARAVQIADGETTNYFLTTFGRAKRETVCTCEVSMEPNLSQALHMLNGQTAHGRVEQGGVVNKLLVTEKKTPEQVIENLYLRCFNRKPTETELSTLAGYMPKEVNEQKKVLEDVFWALLNSEEFMFNH